MESITVQDLNDFNIAAMTIQIAQKFELPQIKLFLYDNTELGANILDNLARDECWTLLVEVYNSKVRLMVAQTVMEESKEDSSEPPSELNEGFIAPQEVHQSAVQIRGPHPQ